MDIKASSGNTSRDQNRSLAIPECANGILTLTLSTIGVDGRARNIEVEEVIIDLVGSALRIDEDDRTSGRSRHQ
jgi:hypothetical protein